MPIAAMLAILFAGEPTLGERLEKLAPHAAGLALVEAVELQEVDQRPSDGPLSLQVKLRILRSTGATRDVVGIVMELGGLQAPGTPPFKPHGPGKLDTFRKGGRYWVAYSSQYDWERCPQGVVAVWPEKEVPKELDEAVPIDHYGHRPVYDPKSGFTHSYRSSQGGKFWTVRMERGGKLLWERELPGEKFTGEKLDEKWGLVHRGNWKSLREADKNPSGYFLCAETTYKLSVDNAFGLPPEQHRLTYVLDADGGKTAAVWVSGMDRSPTSSPSVVQYFDLKTGARRREERIDVPQTGGKAAGADDERWLRKTVRSFDADGQRVVKEEVLRLAGASFDGEYWAPIGTPSAKKPAAPPTKADEARESTILAGSLAVIFGFVILGWGVIGQVRRMRIRRNEPDGRSRRA